MPEARCDCCDLPESSCGRAAEKRQRAEAASERAATLARPGVIPARYAGRCASCGTGYGEGSPIAKRSGIGANGWNGECCL